MQYLFIHGLGQTSSSWDETIHSIKKPIHPLCPDLCAILNNQDVTYQNLYTSFSKYCDGIAEPLHLCGLSLGSILALHYTLEHPSKVQSLVLIGSQYKIPKFLIKLQNIIFRLLPQSAFQKMGFTKKDFINLTNSMLNLNFSQNLKSISCPTLIICGQKDKANKKASEQLAQYIPKAELQILEHIGHEVNMESPQKLAEVIETFYTTL